MCLKERVDLMSGRVKFAQDQRCIDILSDSNKAYLISIDAIMPLFNSRSVSYFLHEIPDIRCFDKAHEALETIHAVWEIIKQGAKCTDSQIPSIRKTEILEIVVFVQSAGISSGRKKRFFSSLYSIAEIRVDVAVLGLVYVCISVVASKQVSDLLLILGVWLIDDDDITYFQLSSCE